MSVVDKTPIQLFLAANPSVSVDLSVVEINDGRVYDLLKRIKCPGFYRVGTITLAPPLFTKPGTGYSWPRNVSDRTEVGVLAHELGHHVHLTMSDPTRVDRNFPKSGPCVTSYEANVMEKFAETFRLFLLNPSLLHEGRPVRYKFMESLSLKTPESRHWKEVLGPEIPLHMLQRTVSWIRR